MTFTKFIPASKNKNPDLPPAKVAKPAKVSNSAPKTLAGLATLAGPPARKRHFRRQPSSSWIEEDWQAEFHERAAIIEYDAGLPRVEAERKSFLNLIIEWMNAHPAPTAGPHHCAYCSLPFATHDGFPFLNGGNGEHVWLHHGCHDDWIKNRRSEAVQALTAVGITLDSEV